MNSNNYEIFFRLLIEIVNGDGAYSEKVAEVKRQAKEYGEEAENALEELAAWLDE